ncbi:MAG: hypothetical protein CMO80_14590 [Verrucomicrobiales bacterium]|nr:hypothetical protein [Verrucomicrobiales bacterium]
MAQAGNPFSKSGGGTNLRVLIQPQVELSNLYFSRTPKRTQPSQRVPSLPWLNIRYVANIRSIRLTQTSGDFFNRHSQIRHTLHPSFRNRRVTRRSRA